MTSLPASRLGARALALLLILPALALLGGLLYDPSDLATALSLHGMVDEAAFVLGVLLAAGTGLAAGGFFLARGSAAQLRSVAGSTR